MVTLEARVDKLGQVHAVPIDHCQQFAEMIDQTANHQLK